ncbi:hypothetical protein COLO4_36305 [Corchorus olitorius]|uniref:Uncharacterized protein n=1 Tax=Corchorus olitorius TaxID=93759 RepID=A0A1R3GA07_9ROSI|nr:hypothetical protein COLO4_36305 [Corchorus olitorius]
MGEAKKGLLLTTAPTSIASLYTSFTLNDNDNSTLHKLSIVLHTICGESAPPDMHALRILIFNAGGVDNPTFLPIFSQLYNQHRPHFALATETRLAGTQAQNRRLSLEFPESSILDSIGYFGGLWLLSKLDIFTCQLMSRTNMSLSTQVKNRQLDLHQCFNN